MLILGKHITSEVNPLKSKTSFAVFACLLCASASPSLVLAQPSVGGAPASVTVQSGDTSLAAPPSIGAQLGAQDQKVGTNSKAAELFAPVSKENTPKIYTKPISSGPTEMDLRQLWNELKVNNPQLSSLRESYLSAKATVPQINAPANPQVGLVWSGMPANSPFALGGANAPSQQYPGGISSNNSISVAQPFQFPGKKSLAADIADTNAEALSLIHI